MIGPLTPADAPVLALTHAAAMERPWSAAAIEGLLADRGVLCLGDVGSDGDDPDAASQCCAGAGGRGEGGFVMLRIAADEAEILTLAVCPRRRRAGLGRALMTAAHAAAAVRGARAVFLEVAEDNGPARGLYEALGYGLAGRRRGYYPRDGAAAADALILRAVLAGSAPP